MDWLPWSDAAGVAVGTGAATQTLVRQHRLGLRKVAAWTRELTVMFGLYALWQLAGDLSLGGSAHAVARGADLARDERLFGMPRESTFQHLFLGHHDLLKAFNLYYVGLHIAVTGACLVWVFARHRDRYPVVRNALALATGACLLVALVPVAPPRLVPGLGLVDVGRTVGPTVYPATARPGLDQLSAMPSVHVAWALIVAFAVVHVLRSPWKWLAALYPIFTTSVVVATGNHFWADGLVALALVALAVAASVRWSRYERVPPVAHGSFEHPAQPVPVP
ncbi:MAG TPA: phosphatase PAP2 family protein [Acidimicrobiales bacterium]|jgi:hypothetical protein|nr:phosphatase PAP2 family protein [Acidimicrobiales bacterium]